MAISNVILQTTATTVFLADGENAITTMFFCNTDESSSDLVDIYVVPEGTTVGIERMIIKGLELDPKETYAFEAERLILSDGDSIVAAASTTTNVVATVSSVRIS